MSSLERNKGTLVEVGSKADFLGGMDEMEFYDYLSEKGLLNIKDKIYTVSWEVKSQEDCFHFAEVYYGESGEIHFHTMHYNGGGSLEEVLEPYITGGDENG